MRPRPKREDYDGNWDNYHDALFWWAAEAETEITALRARLAAAERVVEAAKSLAFDITEDDDYWRQTESYIDFGLALAEYDAGGSSDTP